MPLKAKSMLFFMRTNLRSKISNGSESRKRDERNAKRFKPLHISSVIVEAKPKKETKLL